MKNNINEIEGNIIWIASYPKSGNTWLRIFLNNLLSQQKEPVDINSLHETGSISSSRRLFDELIGIDSADFRQDEIDYYLPLAHKMHSAQLIEKEFIKTHDAFTKNRDGKWIIPIEATFKAIYIVRNPLDVCVSFAYHIGHNDFDHMIKCMSHPKMTLSPQINGQQNQLHQYLGTWSNHINSWHKLPSNKLLVVRYEDMKEKTLETFTKIVQFANLSHSKEEIEDALDKSKMSRLQKMEDDLGFREKMQKAKRFFRKGIVGSWKEELSKSQIQQIISDHKELMIKLNYLNENGSFNI